MEKVSRYRSWWRSLRHRSLLGRRVRVGEGVHPVGVVFFYGDDGRLRGCVGGVQAVSVDGKTTIVLPTRGRPDYRRFEVHLYPTWDSIGRAVSSNQGADSSTVAEARGEV